MRDRGTARSEGGSRFDMDLRRWFDSLPSWISPFESMRMEEEQKGDSFIVRAEMPGIDPDRDADIWIADGMLHIKCERTREMRSDEEQSEGSFRSEFSYGSFHRAIALPKGVGVDEVKATYKGGVLEVTIPMRKDDDSVSRVQITKE